MYQKMISYIYEYRNGERGKNIGFAKLALQNQNYKIKIQLKLMQGGRRELAVYGFIRGEGIIHTACFGNIKLENGFGDVMFSGNSGKVWKEKNFMKMSGFLFLPKEQVEYGRISSYCVTQWDDDPIVIETLDFLQNREKREEESLEERPESSKPQEMVLHAAELVEVADCQEGVAACVEEPRDILEETKKIINENAIRTQTEEIKEKPKDSQNEKQESELINETQKNESEDSWKMFEQRRKSMRKKWENLQQECKSENLEWKLGEDILKKFPVMNPFFDQEVVSSVRIEPKDLGNFPMEHWYLANNSFLLHGYYYYRHLLFLKMHNQQEYMYAIGVPGNNDYRENFMANMFGFEQFKVVQNRNNAGFGYWWKRIV